VEYRNLGGAGLKVSEVGLGSWLTFGRSVDQSTTDACVRKAFDLGVIFFDTADIYAKGAAEVAFGKALADIRRQDIVLATKVFWPMSENPNDRGLSRKHIIESCEASLERLGTDYVDLYQCHRHDPEVPIEEVVLAMDTLVRQGKVLYWGVSCWTSPQIRDACAIADRRLAFRPVSNQPPYSLLDREIEKDVIPTSDELGLGQVVFSPLGEGLLTGKYAGGKIPEGSRAADPKAGQFIKPLMTDENMARVERFVEIARSIERDPATVALAWCLRQRNVASVIAGATRVEHVEANVRASGTMLPDDALAALDELFAPGDD
jgi:aryl-alcohol dehydrogenase-like predicted oxidoreductase